MGQNKNVDHELYDAKSIGVRGSCLHAVQGLVEPWDTQKAVNPHQRGFKAEGKVKEVSGQQRSQVPYEVLRAQVVLPQPGQVLYQDPLIQETCEKEKQQGRIQTKMTLTLLSFK